MTHADSPFTIDTVLGLLKSEGLRITKARVAILKALFAAKEPVTLQDLQDAARSHGGAPDYATVFRIIGLMEKLHLVHKVNLQRSCSYYELNDPRKHYDHLVCKGCGHVVILDIPCPLGEAERFISKHYGFEDLSHSLEFFGVCPDCRKAG